MEEDIEMLEEFAHDLLQDYIYSPNEVPECDKKLSKAIENLIKEYKELEEYKKYAELTKISCCTAQNCGALNNAIREGIENQKLREEIEDRKYDIENNYIPKSKVQEIIQDIDNSQPVIAELKLRKLVEGDK